MSAQQVLGSAAAESERETDSADSPSDQELLRLELFDSVDMTTIRPLLRNCTVRTLCAGEVLIHAGRPNLDLYLVLSGQLSVRLDSAGAVPITQLGPGESVGEMSVIDHQPTSAFVVVEADARVLVIDEELMWVLVNTSHAIATNLLLTLSKRMRYGNNLIFEKHARLELYRFHATIDALTGLFNRRWLDSMLPRQMERSRMCHKPFSLLMVDIDNFKQYNDENGHVAADQAIGAVGHAIQTVLRPSDTGVRYGGDEFLLLLPDCPLDAGEQVAKRLRCAISDTRIQFADGGRELPSVTISVGAAEMSGCLTLESFVAAADAALYRAKRAGRDRAST